MKDHSNRPFWFLAVFTCLEIWLCLSIGKGLTLDTAKGTRWRERSMSGPGPVLPEGSQCLATVVTTGAHAIINPHAIITSISYHRHTGLLPIFVVCAEHTTQYIIWWWADAFQHPSGSPFSLPSDVNIWSMPRWLPQQAGKCLGPVALLFVYMQWCKCENDTFRAAVCQRIWEHMILIEFCC